VNGFIYSLAIARSNASILFAGTYHGGVYKSTDGGASWNPTGPGLNPSAVVYALAVDPTNPNIVFAGTRGDANNVTSDCSGLDSGGSNVYDYGGGVYRSTDGGATWKKVDEGLGCGYIYGLAIDPSNPKLIYVATHQRGVMRSTDGGDHFSYQTSGLSDLSTRSIVIDPKDSNTLYVATWHRGSVYKGTNSPGLITWNTANVGLGDLHVIKLAVDKTQGGSKFCSLLYALLYNSGTGLARSGDCGHTWTPVGAPGIALYSYDLAVDPTAPSNLFLGMTGLGVNKSTSGGVSWTPANHGLYNTSINTLVVDPAVPTTFLCRDEQWQRNVYQPGTAARTGRPLARDCHFRAISILLS